MNYYYFLIPLLLLIVVLIYFSLQKRQFVSQYITIPGTTLKSMKRSARTRDVEEARVLDYEPGRKRPVQIKKSWGSNSAVRPRVDSDDEIVIHTHPRSATKDPVLRVYENELRRRPSAADVNAVLRDDNDNAFLVTHKGDVVRMQKVPPNNSKINLNQEEQRIQMKVTKGKLKNTRDARSKAQRVNREFIKQTEMKGVRVTKVPSNDITVKEKVRSNSLLPSPPIQLQSTEDIPNPTRRGWRIFRIFDNQNVSGELHYKGHKSGNIEKKGKVSITFLERGRVVSRWNTHGRDDLSELHHHDIIREKDVGKKHRIPFKKSPSISRRYMKKLDQMSPEELKKERKKYE